MRSLAILVLPTLVLAQQIPFLDQVKGWFANGADAVKSQASSVTQPVVHSAASVIAGGIVERITLENYRAVLAPSLSDEAKIDEWMLMITGGNKSCHGSCGTAETEWNKSIPLLTATKASPHLGLLNCESEPVLCAAWAVTPPTLMHMLISHPQADQSQPASTVRYIAINRTSITAHEFAAIHTEAKYKEQEPYQGIWHPFDGPLARYGLSAPVGYALSAFFKVPTWVYMVAISMGTKRFTNRRMTPNARGGPRQGPGAGAGRPA